MFWTNTARGSASIEVWQEEEEEKKGDQEKDNVKETNEQLVSREGTFRFMKYPYI